MRLIRFQSQSTRHAVETLIFVTVRQSIGQSSSHGWFIVSYQCRNNRRDKAPVIGPFTVSPRRISTTSMAGVQGEQVDDLDRDDWKFEDRQKVKTLFRQRITGKIKFLDTSLKTWTYICNYVDVRNSFRLKNKIWHFRYYPIPKSNFRVPSIIPPFLSCFEYICCEFKRLYSTFDYYTLIYINNNLKL